MELCAGIVQPFLERYYLSVALLLQRESGELTKAELVSRCTDAAEQLSMIYALDSPDLFEAGLFANLVDSLLEQGRLFESSGGGLTYGDSLKTFAESLGLVLRSRVRQTLQHAVGATTAFPPHATASGSAIGEP